MHALTKLQVTISTFEMNKDSLYTNNFDYVFNKNVLKLQ